MTTQAPPSPQPTGAVNRVLRLAAKIEPGELPAVIAAFFLFFFVLGTYFAVRPVRETVATILGNDVVADIWLWTALFSIAVVPVYGWLVARVRRSVLLPWIYGFVAITFAVVGFDLQLNDNSEAIGRFFYVWISVLNLLLVSVFWSFLLEMFTAEQSHRLFGAIAAGGTIGALVGPLITRLSVDAVGNGGIMFIGTAGFVGAIVCQRILIAIWKRSRADGALSAAAAGIDKGMGGNPFAGITIVAKSPYLLGIALFIVLLSAANTFVYFEQLRIVTEFFPDRVRRTEVFANIEIVVQSLTLFTQLFLTGRIVQSMGVRTLLSILPIAMTVGFTVLAFVGTFPVLAVVFVIRRWGEYAFNRPGREMLFSKLDTETKYKAKQFVDVPVYRAADYVGAQVKTGLDVVTGSPTVSMIVAAVLAAVWAVNGRMLGRKHDGGMDAGPRGARAHAAAE